MPARPSRRRFLRSASRLAGAGLAGAGLTAPPRAATIAREHAVPSPQDGVRHSSFDPWIDLYPAHLAHNVRQVSARVDGRPILAVIKNNGYGVGVVEAARLLEPLEPVSGFAVVKLQEAVRLREAGVRKPVLLMGPFDEADLHEIAAREIMPMVYTPVADMLGRVAARRGPIQIHVCIDTGLGREGVPYRQAAALVRDLAARRSVSIVGVMTTLSEDPDLDQEQLVRFTALTGDLARQGIVLGLRHVASSFGLFEHPGAFFDMVRPGMALYGVYSAQPFRTAGAMDLQPALALRARVAYVKQLRAGESAGYNRAYVATDDVWVATLPVGHGDGWPRAAARGARVRIGGTLYPVIASVSASHTIVEIGREPRVAIGDVATLWDWQPGSRPEDVSAACGASVYDLTMHLSALLPRRVVG